MDHNVFLQAANIRKFVITFLAFVRFFTSMGPNVILHAASPGKMIDHIPCIDKVYPQYGS